MGERATLAAQFEANRRHLAGVAYRMPGSEAEAEDAVQEAWLRLSRSEAGDIANLRGWLTTVVGRICLDMLRSRRLRKEEGLDAHARLASTFVGRARAATEAFIDGQPGAVLAPRGVLRVAFLFAMADDRIVGLELVADPGRLGRLDIAMSNGPLI